MPLKFDADPKVSGGKYLKIESGQSVRGVLRGDVKEYYVKWENGKTTPADETTSGAQFKFKVNIAVMVEDKDKKVTLEPKILDMGAMVYKQLKALAEDYNLEETVIKISREGTGLKTEYSVMPLPAKLNDKQKKAISDLEMLSFEDEESVDATPSFDSNEEIPF